MIKNTNHFTRLETLKEVLEIAKQYQKKKYKVLEPQEIKWIRNRLGMSQSVFAKFIGVSSTTINNWEQGKKSPSNGKSAVKINYLYDCSEEELHKLLLDYESNDGQLKLQ